MPGIEMRRYKEMRSGNSKQNDLSTLVKYRTFFLSVPLSIPDTNPAERYSHDEDCRTNNHPLHVSKEIQCLIRCLFRLSDTCLHMFRNIFEGLF
jgi:hypothetical protein